MDLFLGFDGKTTAMDVRLQMARAGLKPWTQKKAAQGRPLGARNVSSLALEVPKEGKGNGQHVWKSHLCGEVHHCAVAEHSEKQSQ